MERLPGGLWVASVEGRVNVNRPWQEDPAKLADDASKCDFAKADEMRVREHEPSGDSGWRVINNQREVSPFQRMILPLACWHMSRVRKLGGPSAIKAVLHIVDRLEKQKELYVMAHIGRLAGQNQPHLHWHVLTPPGSEHLGRSHAANVAGYFASSTFVLSDEGGLRIVVGGHKAGQCYFLPVGPDKPFTEQNALLAERIHSIIELYARKFAGPYPPEFQVCLKFKSGALQYATYIPILNHPGGTENLALSEGSAYILPWPHEATFKHLLGDG